MTLSSIKILIVDDEAYVVTLLAHKLRQAGATVTIASNGAIALKAALEEIPDLVITDYQMPVMSGLELCTQLKVEPTTSALPVLMLTSRGHRVTAAELAATNIRSLIAKPFSMRELLQRVEEIASGTDQASGNGGPDTLAA